MNLLWSLFKQEDVCLYVQFKVLHVYSVHLLLFRHLGTNISNLVTKDMLICDLKCNSIV